MNPSGNGVAPDFLAETKEPELAQTDSTDPASNGTGQPYVPETDQKQASLKERVGMWLAGGIVGLLLVLVVASRISPRNRTAQTNSPLDGPGLLDRNLFRVGCDSSIDLPVIALM